MAAPKSHRFPQAARLGDQISDGAVSKLFYRYLESVGGMHDDIAEKTSSVEIRLFFGDELVCRLVPYRELFHVQIGDGSVWETRVRNEAMFEDTLDHTLHRFLELRAAKRPENRGQGSDNGTSEGG